LFVAAADMKFLVVLGVLVAAACAAQAENERPIIGILDQEWNETHTYIAASYVKWIESGGARVVPLLNKQWDTVTMENMLKNLNGVMFPGGDAEIEGHYLDQINTIFNFAKKQNDIGNFFPLWGTCLGFEELLIAAAGSNILDYPLDSHRMTLALNLTSNALESNLFKAMPDELKAIVTKEPVTYNNHEKGIFPSHFNKLPALYNFFDILSTNKDNGGLEFVSTIEAKNYPFFGSQWHPEKIQYEWTPDGNINHSYDSVELNSWTSRFFVQQCRKNNNAFPDEKSEKEALIYEYTPTYTADEEESFVQCYLFN